MSDNAEITFDDRGSACIVQAEPLVTSEKFYTFVVHKNKVLGHIKATFDFSNLPNELHQLALQMIQNDQRRVWLPSDSINIDTQGDK